MKNLSSSELQAAANLLWALDHTEPLEIIQYVRGQEDPATYRQIAEAIGISDSLVKYNASRLEQEGILTVMPAGTFEDPEAGLVQMKELSDMPTLAQAIILELWPDWYELPEVKSVELPPPLFTAKASDYDMHFSAVTVSKQEKITATIQNVTFKLLPTRQYVQAGILVPYLKTLTGNEGRQYAETFNKVCSEMYGFLIDLEDPEAPWNSTQQPV